MVLKANDRRTSCPCHDEFRGPRSDYVRQYLIHGPGVGDHWLRRQDIKLGKPEIGIKVSGKSTQELLATVILILKQRQVEISELLTHSTLFHTMPDAAAEWSRYRIVAVLVTSLSPVPQKIHRVGSDAR
ncbi:hypothetical protein TNCV_5117061 [Trichonephila clavipes]|nr:hypothetical protein TNCV_5117061 [Trichonephila clavipes]